MSLAAPSRAQSAASKASPAPQAKPEAKILFQKFFKSVGPRTYAAQVKEAGNGNQFLVFTEGKRDENTGEVRKTRLFVYSEDFVEFFRMLHDTAQWIKANPISEEMRKRRKNFWAKKAAAANASSPAQTTVPPSRPAPGQRPVSRKGPVSRPAPAKSANLRK